MSYYDEYAADTIGDEDIERIKIESEAKSGYWTTKDGKVMHVTKMTDKHIRNTIKLIEKHDKTDMYWPWVCVFNKELQRRNNIGA